MSINQIWPGYVAGEWHNNHHLYPKSARSGFLPYQLDLAWLYVKMMHSFGAVISYRDDRKEFYKVYHTPYLNKNKKGIVIPEKELIAEQVD
jgi:stearoyl-CoA desaturase (delta-9 desaturase)